jgi:hypothetical protein
MNDPNIKYPYSEVKTVNGEKIEHFHIDKNTMISRKIERKPRNAKPGNEPESDDGRVRVPGP